MCSEGSEDTFVSGGGGRVVWVARDMRAREPMTSEASIDASGSQAHLALSRRDLDQPRST